VKENCSKLVEERPCRHEVPGFHDDRRQDDREEYIGVELDDFILITTEVRYYSQCNADHYQQAALRTEVFQTFTCIETCTIQKSIIFHRKRHASQFFDQKYQKNTTNMTSNDLEPAILRYTEITNYTIRLIAVR